MSTFRGKWNTATCGWPARHIGIVIVSIVLWGLGGCAEIGRLSPQVSSRLMIRQLHQQLPPLNQPIHLIQLSPEQVEKQAVDNKTENILFLVRTDGLPLEYNAQAEILLFENAKDQQPLYHFTPTQLQTMHKTTQCAPSLIPYIADADAGDALFCNRSLQLERIHHFVLKKSEEDVDTATSYSVDFQKPNITAVTLSFD